jgi:RND family efflux transporter MFP subunit
MVKYVLAVVLLGTAVGCAVLAFRDARRAKSLGDPAAARSQGRPIPVRTAAVEESEIEHVIGATALTSASETAVIQLGATNGFRRTDLVLQTVHVYEGDYVEQGQTLFTLKDETYRAVLRQAEAALTAAETYLTQMQKQVTYSRQIRELELESAKSEMEYRQKDLEVRKKELDALGGLRLQQSVSLFTMLEATAIYYKAGYERKAASWRLRRAEVDLQMVLLQNQSNLTKAQSELETARMEVRVAKRDVERCQITSPIAGFVTRVDLVPGQVLAVNVPLVQVLRLDPIHVRVDFPQERIDEIAVGGTAEAILDSSPRDTFSGEVIRIAPQVDPKLRVLPVVVRVGNPRNRLKAGVSGYVRIRMRKRVCVVPAVAVIEHEGKAMVFRVEEGRARLRGVRTGAPMENGMVEVEGLKAGEEVVVFHNFYRHPGELTRGNGYLQDNDPVDTNWKKWTRRE